MLILADADGFRLDLDQFRQRVLQAAGNGHRAAQRHIHFGEFPRRQFRSGIDRCACFRHHQLVQIQIGMTLDQFGRQPVGFPRSRAIANADQFDFMALTQVGQGVNARIPLIARDMGINRGGFHQFAGGVHHRDLDAGAQAGIESQRRTSARWRRQQQIAQITGEHSNRFFLGGFAQTLFDLGIQMRQQLNLPGPAGGFPQPGVSGPAFVANLEMNGNPPFAGIGRVCSRIAQFQGQLQNTFIAAPEQRQSAM